MTAPAFGSLQPTLKKIAFCFAIPTIVYLGSLYSVRVFLLALLPQLDSPQSSVIPERLGALRVLPPFQKL